MKPSNQHIIQGSIFLPYHTSVSHTISYLFAPQNFRNVSRLRQQRLLGVIVGNRKLFLLFGIDRPLPVYLIVYYSVEIELRMVRVINHAPPIPKLENRFYKLVVIDPGLDVYFVP